MTILSPLRGLPESAMRPRLRRACNGAPLIFNVYYSETRVASHPTLCVQARYKDLLHVAHDD